ncbi:hypothetical protein MTO96_020598 [Rhipicephalus appendiculatus]
MEAHRETLLRAPQQMMFQDSSVYPPRGEGVQAAPAIASFPSSGPRRDLVRAQRVNDACRVRATHAVTRWRRPAGPTVKSWHAFPVHTRGDHMYLTTATACTVSATMEVLSQSRRDRSGVARVEARRETREWKRKHRRAPRI